MHNFKRMGIKFFIFLVIVVLCNSLLNFVFIPYSYIRVDYHNIEENEYDLVFVGTSHGKCGIDPQTVEEVTGKRSVNLCLGGAYLSYIYYMVKEVCRHHVPEQIVYEVDGGYWTTDEYIGTDSSSIFGEMSWSPVKGEFFLDRLADKDFRITLFPWYVYRKEYRMIKDNIKNKMSGSYRDYDTSVFKNPTQEYRENGFIYRYPVPDEAKDFTNFVEWDTKEVRKENEEYLKKLAEFCEDKGILLTLLITPVPEVTKEKYADAYEEQHRYFDSLAEQYGLELYDFNYEELEGFDRSLTSYVDYEGHMNGETAVLFSRRLGEYMETSYWN